MSLTYYTNYCNHIRFALERALYLTVLGLGYAYGVVPTPEELLDRKIEDSQYEFSTEESIAVIQHCIAKGNVPAQLIKGKNALVVFGNTGVGKSTFINYLMGCKMIRKKLPGKSGKIVMVDESGESPFSEFTKIGHETESMTLMLGALQDLNNSNRVFCDCPGFNNTRGAEINISNGINVKRVLANAESARFIVLMQYRDITGRAGPVLSLRDSLCNIFGGLGNLLEHEESLLLGITKTPLNDEDGDPIDIQMVREYLSEHKETVGESLVGMLARRLFIYDPLDKRNSGLGYIKRMVCLEKAYEELQPILNYHATDMFKVNLTAKDKLKMTAIIRHQGGEIGHFLAQNQYERAEKGWNMLDDLRKVMDSKEIDKILEELCLTSIKAFIRDRIGEFKICLNDNHDDFEGAEEKLAVLKKLVKHLPKEVTELIHLSELEELLALAKKSKEEAIQKEREYKEEKEKAERKEKEFNDRMKRADEENKRQLELERMKWEKERMAWEQEQRGREMARQREREKFEVYLGETTKSAQRNVAKTSFTQKIADGIDYVADGVVESFKWLGNQFKS